MRTHRLRRALARLLCCCAAGVLATSRVEAQGFSEFVDPHPAAGNQFGATVLPLSSGNVVVTSPYDDFAATDAGAVYLFNGVTGALISTLRGSSADDHVGLSGVKQVQGGNFIVLSPHWDNGAVLDAGAVTWGSGTTGVNGSVSGTNSLVGSHDSDFLGAFDVVVLTNGNYVVADPFWDAVGQPNAGAVTWGSGATGVVGTMSAANSLVGSLFQDQVGNSIVALANGNYVVGSSNVDLGGLSDVGAATWCNGTTGRVGAVSAANSLVGSTAQDYIGGTIVALPNGNYVALSYAWDNGAASNAGAATWGNGASGIVGAVSPANSLVGSSAADNVGSYSTLVLTNGSYVVRSPFWDRGAITDAGAATWCSGTTGRTGTISASNSIVGASASDNVGSGQSAALTGGNFVIAVPFWDNGATQDAGAIVWGNGASGTSGIVSAANSLIGSSTSDNLGNVGIFPLANGNYVVASEQWDSGAVSNAGAVTWGNGATGTTGVVSAANSWIGSATGDQVGNGGVVALTNGNYVTRSAYWSGGGAPFAGAVTWGNGATGSAGVIGPANSLVGSSANDNLGGSGIVPLTNGNYVVCSSSWNNGAIVDAGAVTWGNGSLATSSAVSAANSLVGTSTSDMVGSSGAVALSNGNFVVGCPLWNNGAIADAGASTWGNGATGITGTISAANSLVGSTAFDYVGGSVAISGGNYAVIATQWHNASAAIVGAVVWGSGTSGLRGPIEPGLATVGASVNFGPITLVEDLVNGSLYAAFPNDEGGHVRNATPRSGTPTSLVDVPSDQGGWLRLSFTSSPLDKAGSGLPIVSYGVWRLVPGALAARPSDAALRARPQEAPEGLDAWRQDGRTFVRASADRSPGLATSFPAGTWELVANVPAVQLSQYLVAVPTISNAAPNTYLLTTHSVLPSSWFTAPSISGQSIDNLAPLAPAGIVAAYAGGQTNLSWNPNDEHDLGGYRIYRGTSAGFTPAPANLIASQSATTLGDPGPAGRYYKLSAMDVNGNESLFALVTPAMTADAGDGVTPAFALDGVHPNPARGDALNVRFALASAAPATLELLDVAGRRVRSRDVGALGAGAHVLDLAEGRALASGVYWLRLRQGSAELRARVAVVE